jgi:hypothetical protein
MGESRMLDLFAFPVERPGLIIFGFIETVQRCWQQDHVALFHRNAAIFHVICDHSRVRHDRKAAE